jgi:tetratricopeptide (TPR) repeat protein
MQVAWDLVPKKADKVVIRLLGKARDQGAAAVDIALVKARLAVARGDGSGARRELGEARRAGPRDTRPLILLAEVERDAGNLDLALQHATTGGRLDPNSVELARLRVNLILGTESWQEWDQALQDLEGALRYSGLGRAEGELYRGRAREQRGNLATALAAYGNAVQQDSDNRYAWEAIARVAEAQGNYPDALRATQRLASMLGDNPQRRATRERLEKARDEQKLRLLLR